jgi:hypothetical protein
MSLALALTLAALSAVLVRIFQRRSVILALSIYVAAAWLITFMQPYLEWPSWVLQLSIFHAFGRPYVEWPEFSDVMGISIITFTCLIGALINIRRRPAVIINT